MEGYHVSSLYVLRLKKSNFRRFHAISLLAEKYSCNERRTNSPHLTSFQFHGGKFISSAALRHVTHHTRHFLFLVQTTRNEW